MDKAYRENNPEKERARYRLRKYGVTPEIYQEFFEAQGGVCAICHRPIKLSVDHDHDTDLIRGLLCKDCNLGIGCFGDDPNLVLNAVEYLVR